jgi:DNA polymerase III alpha subunit
MNYIYQNYHKHSERTNPIISDSTVTYKDYAEAAVKYGHSILSSAEHGYQGRYIETYDTAKDYKLKCLIGAEAYWVRNRLAPDNSNCHIWIGAKNENGRQAINDILSEASLTGFYFRPRVDVPLLLSLPKDDVWITTACVAYWKYEDIDSITKTLSNHFGKNFFLEVQYHNTESQKQINKHILTLHNKLKIPLIMGCDSHYISADQHQTREDFLLSKGIRYEDEEGWFLDYVDGQTAYNRFAAQNILTHTEITDAIANTNTFLDVKEYDSPVFNTDIKLPTLYDGEHEIDGVKLPKLDQQGRDEEYKKLVWQGWNEYKDKVPKEDWPRYEKEIQYEVDNVLECHMSDYFIDDYYIVKRGKELGGWLTLTGRGSGVSYFTNKLLGFTDVDRVAAKVKMYPERFMTADRILVSVTLPDLDLNVADQEPFAKAQTEILGEDHAYPMIAYGTYQKSAAWKLYAKAKGVPFETANAVSEQLKRYENAVKHADEEEKDDIDVLDYIDDQFKEIYEDSKDYMGLITSWSIAPCGFLLYQGSIRKEVGLIKIKDHLCCLMDGAWAEKNHFLKNDLLKVSVVDLIYRSYHRAGLEPPPQQELLSMLPPDDKAWNLYKTGCTLGLNQVEQPGTSSRVGKYAPANISELCAFVAAIRPGFKSMYKTFESREPFDYGVKQFDDLIQTEEMPNSFLLYQEMVMTALSYAGISLSEGYTVIKAISKKRVEKILSYKDRFVAGFSERLKAGGTEQDEAADISNRLWQIIEDSSQYSFNASHAYCVSLDSVYSAWIKAHHHLAFYETLLQIQEKKGNKDKMVEIKREAENYFGTSFPPYRFGQDNREIRANFETNEINNSIKAIKGLPKVTGDLLWTVAEQHPKSMTDILFLCKQYKVSDAAIENLAKISFFSPFGNDVEILRIIKLYHFFSEGTAKKIKKDKIENQDILKILSKYATDTNTKGEELSQWSITSPEIQTAEAKIKAVKAKLKPYKDIDPPADLTDELESAIQEEEQLRLKYEQQMLNEMEQYILSIEYDDLDFRNKMANQMEILGYVDLTTGREEDRRKLLIEDVQPMKDKKTGKPWCYRVDTRSIGSGKSARLSIPVNTYDETPIRKGDTIFTPQGSLKKNAKGYWYLYWYDMVYC